MKVTDIELGKYYGITAKTVSNYRNGSIEKKRLYFSLLDGYGLPVIDKMNMNNKELFRAKEFYLQRIQYDVDQVQTLDDILQDKIN